MKDALGYTIQKLISEDGADPDCRYDVTVITDGDTNADRKCNTQTLMELKDGCEKAGNWTFTFVGCTAEQALKAQQEYGFKAGNVAHVDLGLARGVQSALSNIAHTKSAYYSNQLRCSEALFNSAGVVADWSTTAVDTAGGVSPPVTTTDVTTLLTVTEP